LTGRPTPGRSCTAVSVARPRASTSTRPMWPPDRNRSSRRHLRAATTGGRPTRRTGFTSRRAATKAMERRCRSCRRADPTSGASRPPSPSRPKTSPGHPMAGTSWSTLTTRSPSLSSRWTILREQTRSRAAAARVPRAGSASHPTPRGHPDRGRLTVILEPRGLDHGHRSRSWASGPQPDQSGELFVIDSDGRRQPACGP
jgi:hypothetical protein